MTVDSSTWLSEIVRYRRKEILDRLQNTFGKADHRENFISDSVNSVVGR